MVDVLMVKQSTDCILYRGETGAEWLCAQPHSVSSPAIPAETTERGLMNQPRNKKAETIMNQRIIGADRALFLSLSSGSRSISQQPINQTADVPASQSVSPWQPLPSELPSGWKVEARRHLRLSFLSNCCQQEQSSY